MSLEAEPSEEYLAVLSHLDEEMYPEDRYQFDPSTTLENITNDLKVLFEQFQNMS